MNSSWRQRFIDFLQGYWIPIISSLMLWGFVNILLFGYAERDRSFDLAQPLGEYVQTPIDFQVIPTSESNRKLFKLELSAHDFENNLARTEKINLFFGTHGSRPDIVAGIIKIKDTLCIFQADQKRILDNQFVQFVRLKPCVIFPRKMLELSIEFELKNASNLSLWTARSSSNVTNENSPIVMLDTGNDRHFAVGYIDGQHNNPLYRRIDKLSYLWGFEADSPQFIMFIVGLITGLAVSLFFVLSFSLRLLPLNRWVMVVFTALLIFTSTGLIATFSPPLQAPDEPDHIMGYLLSTAQKSRIEELKSLATQTHFERIKFRNSQYFRSNDISQPFPVAWSQHVASQRIESRSTLTSRLWQAYHRMVPAKLNMGKTILTLRFFNTTLWAMIWTVGFSLFALSGKENFQILFRRGMSLALIPILSFFVMHISDFSIAAIFTIGGIFCFMALPHLPNVIVPGIFTGLFIQASLLGNKATLIASPLILPMAWHAIFSRTNGRNPDKRAPVKRQLIDGSIFWILSALICSLPIIEIEHAHLKALLYNIDRVGSLPSSLNWFFTLENYRFVGLILSTIGLLGTIFYGVLNQCVSILANQRVHDFWLKFSRLSLILFLLSIISFAVLSLNLHQLPQLQNIEVLTKPSIHEYTLNLFKVLVTSVRLDNFDFYLQTSFWGGFGWLDLNPPTYYLAAQNLVFISVLAGYLTYWRANSPIYGLTTTVFWFFSSSFILMLQVYMLHSIGTNIHGRYLLPIYLFNFGYFLIREPTVIDRPNSNARYDRIDWKVLAYPLFYGYAFTMLIHRYLG